MICIETNVSFRQCCKKKIIYHDELLKGSETGDCSVCSLGAAIDAACLKRCHCLQEIKRVIVPCFVGMRTALEQILFNIQFCI